MDMEILTHPSQPFHFQLRRRQASIYSMEFTMACWWSRQSNPKKPSSPKKKLVPYFRCPTVLRLSVGNKSGRRHFPNGVMLLWALFSRPYSSLYIFIYAHCALLLYYCINWRGEHGVGSLFFLLFVVFHVLIYYLYMNWGSYEPFSYSQYYYYACRVCCRKSGKQYLFISTLFAGWVLEWGWHWPPLMPHKYARDFLDKS